MIRIEAPHFVAGVETREGIVTRCAPIVGYMRAWSLDRVAAYVRKKRWSAEEIET